MLSKLKTKYSNQTSFSTMTCLMKEHNVWPFPVTNEEERKVRDRFMKANTIERGGG